MAMNKQMMPSFQSGLGRQDMPTLAHPYGTCTNQLDAYKGLHMLGLGYASVAAESLQPLEQTNGGGGLPKP